VLGKETKLGKVKREKMGKGGGPTKKLSEENKD